MKTKTIEKTIVEQTEIYISADGREWTDKEECLKWEKGVKCVAKAGWDKIPKKEITSTKFGIPYSAEDKECYLLVPRTHDDIVIIHNYMASLTDYYSEVDDTFIGIPIVMDFGFDGDYCDVYRIEEYLNKALESVASYVDELNEEGMD